jgi:hypothetical protein
VPALCAVNTSITLFGPEGKAILVEKIGVGEHVAMLGSWVTRDVRSRLRGPSSTINNRCEYLNSRTVRVTVLRLTVAFR